MSVSTLVAEQTLKTPPFCAPDISILEASVKIADLDVNALAVTDAGNLVGIITDHDIIRCMAKTGGDAKNQLVGDWMSRKVISCPPGMRLNDALNLMAARRIRHLVVSENNKPITIISSKELLTRVHENNELEIRVLRDLATAVR